VEPDAFEDLRERLAVLDAFERDRRVHWADPLFRGLVLERKVTTSLVSEIAARRRDAPGGGGTHRGVLVVDVQACGGGVGAVHVLRRLLPLAAEIAYVGFGVPPRGSRGLIERGLAEEMRRFDGPPVRSAFHAGDFLDVVDLGDAWHRALGSFGWTFALGFEGRVGRTGPDPMTPGGLARLGDLDGAVVSFLDPHDIGASLPRLAMLSAQVDQPLEIVFDALHDGRAAPMGSVEVGPGPPDEAVRWRLLEILDDCMRFAHRARIRPAGALRGSGEVVELPSPGWIEDHLLAAHGPARLVPAGCVRAAVLGDDEPAALAPS